MSQLKEQLRELDVKITSEESKLASFKSGSQRSVHVVGRELNSTQKSM